MIGRLSLGLNGRLPPETGGHLKLLQRHNDQNFKVWRSGKNIKIKIEFESKTYKIATTSEALYLYDNLQVYICQ